MLQVQITDYCVRELKEFIDVIVIIMLLTKMYCLLFIEFEPNVEYVEFTIPSDFPFQLRKYLPNIHFSPHDVLDDEGIR